MRNATFQSFRNPKKYRRKKTDSGKKNEEFLLKKILILVEFLRKIIAARNTTFFGCLFVAAISILVHATRDIGHDSALYLEIAQKMLDGGKYYHDFFEPNLPLPFLLTTIPVFLARSFSIHPIIAAEIFVNLIGILSLYCSAKILARACLQTNCLGSRAILPEFRARISEEYSTIPRKFSEESQVKELQSEAIKAPESFSLKTGSRSELVDDRTVFNLVILSFAIGFFLRVFTLQFNEFLTKSTYLLALVYPYVSYHLIDRPKLKIADQILTGLFAGLLFCLKPNYGIIVIVFELEKIFRARSLKPAFSLENYTTVFVSVSYLLLSIILFPEYLKAVSSFFLSYHKASDSLIPTVLHEDIYPVFAFIYLSFFLIKKNRILWRMFLLSVAAILVVMSEVIGGYDQRFVIYSLSLPFVVLTISFLVRGGFFDFRKNGFFLLLLILIPQFDAKNIFPTLINLCLFWWVFVLFFRKRVISDQSFLSQIFAPHNLASFLCFSGLALSVFILSFSHKFGFLSWFLSAALFILMADFYQKKFSPKKFSRLSSGIIFSIISYFISLHLAAIFNFRISNDIYKYKSPNHFSDEVIKTIKLYSGEGENVISIAELISGTYPMITYSEKINDLPFAQFPLLFYKINSSEEKMDDVGKYQLSRLKRQLPDEKNKLVLIEIKNTTYDQKQCNIGFLEYYFFRDDEFRKIFLQNYRFLNRIISHANHEQKTVFFNEDQALELPDATTVERDVEVYIRK